MKTLRVGLALAFTLVAGSGDPAGAQTLYRSWHLTMADIQARSRVAVLRGERRHDAQGGVRIQGIFAERQGSEAQPEEIFFSTDMTTTLLRGTEYDPDFLNTSIAFGYRHRRIKYTIDLYAEHLRRMNTDRLGRLNANFFGMGIADPEFDLRRFGVRRRLHGRVAAGSMAGENGFNSNGRYLAAFRYDYEEFVNQRIGRLPLFKGQIFIEGQLDALHGPSGWMTDVEGGIRFLFIPDADNSLSVAAKVYDSKNPLGHGDDGVRIELDLEGGHAGELFKRFYGNTAGEVVLGFRGEDVATELEADFDLMRIPFRRREYVIVLDSLQRATWGKLNKIEYNLKGAVETVMDDRIRYVGRLLQGMIAGLDLDHRSTHGLDRVLPEKNYNILGLSLKSPGWDSGRENETRGRIAGFFAVGRYLENTFKKSRDWDARTGILMDGRERTHGTWVVAPYVKGTLRNATNHGRKCEATAEAGLRFNGNALFARWTQDAYTGEGGLGGLALRF